MNDKMVLRKSIKDLKGAGTSLFCGGALLGLSLGAGHPDATLAGILVGAVFVGVALTRMVKAQKAIELVLQEPVAANDAA